MKAPKLLQSKKPQSPLITQFRITSLSRRRHVNAGARRKSTDAPSIQLQYDASLCCGFVQNL